MSIEAIFGLSGASHGMEGLRKRKRELDELLDEELITLSDHTRRCKDLRDEVSSQLSASAGQPAQPAVTAQPRTDLLEPSQSASCAGAAVQVSTAMQPFVMPGTAAKRKLPRSVAKVTQMRAPAWQAAASLGQFFTRAVQHNGVMVAAEWAKPLVGALKCVFVGCSFTTDSLQGLGSHKAHCVFKNVPEPPAPEAEPASAASFYPVVLRHLLDRDLITFLRNGLARHLRCIEEDDDACVLFTGRAANVPEVDFVAASALLDFLVDRWSTERLLRRTDAALGYSEWEEACEQVLREDGAQIYRLRLGGWHEGKYYTYDQHTNDDVRWGEEESDDDIREEKRFVFGLRGGGGWTGGGVETLSEDSGSGEEREEQCEEESSAEEEETAEAPPKANSSFKSRKSYSIRFKASLLDKLKCAPSGTTLESIAVAADVESSLLVRWRQNEAKIYDAAALALAGKSKRVKGGGRKPAWPAMEKLLLAELKGFRYVHLNRTEI